MVSIIVAIAKNGVIGKSGAILPWRLSADLKRFKKLTSEHAIIMGRKTYQTINRPLPNRTNIIVTRDKTFRAKGCKVASSIEEAFKIAQKSIGNNEIFIIGGAEIFKLAIPYVDKIYLTKVNAEVEGDTFFEIDQTKWKVAKQEDFTADEKNEFDYSFIDLVKI